MSNTPDVIRLNNNDNVVVCIKSLPAGNTILVNGQPVLLDANIGIGHKLAARDIKQHEPITKYGVPIGTAVVDIPFGGHVHTHNMKSDYIETYLIEH